jgi:hypothetical protein
MLDYVAVGAWFVYNAHTTVHIVLHTDTVHVPLFVLAVANAFATVALNVVRTRYQYRTRTRDMLHVTMHACGAIGTTCLLACA